MRVGRQYQIRWFGQRLEEGERVSQVVIWTETFQAKETVGAKAWLLNSEEGALAGGPGGRGEDMGPCWTVGRILAFALNVMGAPGDRGWGKVSEQRMNMIGLRHS